jgi:hypothetical protein
MTKLHALHEPSPLALLDRAESLTDDAPEVAPLDPRNLADRSLGELSMEQLARLAAEWADDVIPRSPALVSPIAGPASNEHVNPLLVDLWSRGELRGDYIDLWRSHTSKCAICRTLIEAASRA